jgi:hypothetical protein
MVVYQPQQERRLRHRVGEFEVATKQAGHQWILHDLTDAFPRWLMSLEYAESYFEDPDALEITIGGLLETVVAQVKESLAAADETSVVALLGVGSLYPFVRVSEVIESVNPWILGRLVVFFPGDYSDNVYRLLNARDGWNYMAVPITAA